MEDDAHGGDVFKRRESEARGDGEEVGEIRDGIVGAAQLESATLSVQPLAILKCDG